IGRQVLSGLAPIDSEAVERQPARVAAVLAVRSDRLALLAALDGIGELRSEIQRWHRSTCSPKESTGGSSEPPLPFQLTSPPPAAFPRCLSPRPAHCPADAAESFRARRATPRAPRECRRQ